jgi:hypothetical protein
MYILPSPYKCQKCGFECEYSPHETHPAPVVHTNFGPVISCPKCWMEWLKENLGEMNPKPSEPNTEVARESGE